jgi:large subunit ribosomal protein L4
MPTVDVYNLGREKTAEIELSDVVFGCDVKEHLLHAVVRYQLAKRRQGTHKVKGRAEVSGGGKKPYKQKGTGRARAGTTRAPQWRGGGVVHGPVPRNYAFKLNKKERAAALRGALSKRVQDGSVVVLEAFELPEIKTRQVVDFMSRFEMSDALVVLSAGDEVVSKSARNLKSITVLPVEGVNVYDVLRRRNLVLTRDAVTALTQRLEA